MMGHCWFISCNKSTILVGEVDNGGGCGGDVYGKSL